jgi:rhodanese-related sulfurtransferase
MTRPSWSLLASLLATVLIIGDVALGEQPSVLTVEQLHAALSKGHSREEKGFILVDVRTPEEHRAGMIPGTDFNIDFREIAARHRELGAQLDDHIVVYCQSGRRSSIAAKTLADLGYRHVYNVDGSMNAWMEAGFPVERPRR